MRAAVLTAHGTYDVDLDEEEVLGLDSDGSFEAVAAPEVALPRLVAAAQSGTTVIAVVEAKPPLLVSWDGGLTWSESGRGLPGGRAVAVSEDDPDAILYGARNRLYLSRDGGRFWRALTLELPEIEAVAFTEA